MPNNSYLIDTSAWIFALRKDFIPIIKDRIDHLLKQDVVMTTGIIKLEIISGAGTQKEFQRLKSRFNAFDEIKTDDFLWQEAFELGFKLRRKGLAIPHTDILIATCALQTGSIIVHADTHFDMMATHAGLGVESFVQAVRERI